MELTNEFKVDVPVDKAFEVLTDVERIAPCMPGAQLQEIEGEEYRGIVKVKVGPITAQYKGAARFLERDEEAHRAVLRAEGRDTRGQGNANATITASLVPDGDGTMVTVSTDLTVTGRVAQFGRGVMADVSSKLLGQFVDCLEHQVLSGDASGGDAVDAATDAPEVTGTAPAESAVEPLTESVTAVADDVDERAERLDAPAESAVVSRDAPSVRRIESPEAEPVDLLDTAGAPVAKRAVPLVLGVIALVWLVRLFVKRRRRSG
jgi:carbon monoxide dehydrogenase subunit G